MHMPSLEYLQMGMTGGTSYKKQLSHQVEFLKHAVLLHFAMATEKKKWQEHLANSFQNGGSTHPNSVSSDISILSQIGTNFLQQFPP